MLLIFVCLLVVVFSCETQHLAGPSVCSRANSHLRPFVPQTHVCKIMYDPNHQQLQQQMLPHELESNGSPLKYGQQYQQFPSQPPAQHQVLMDMSATGQQAVDSNPLLGSSAAAGGQKSQQFAISMEGQSIVQKKQQQNWRDGPISAQAPPPPVSHLSQHHVHLPQFTGYDLNCKPFRPIHSSQDHHISRCIQN